MKFFIKKTLLSLLAVSLVTSAILNPEVIVAVSAEKETTGLNSIGEERQEIVVKRDEYSKTYLNSNGTFTTEMSPTPIHYYDRDKQIWKEINTDLEETSEGITTVSHPLSIILDPKINTDAHLLEISDDKYEININPISETKYTDDNKEKSSLFKSVTENNTVTYSNVFDNADLKYSVGNDRIKEEIILKEKPEKSDEPTLYTFSLDIKNLTYKQQDNGSILLLDKESGETKYYIEAPIMYDSFKPEGYKENENISSIPEEALSYDVKYELREEGDVLYLDLIPNKEWLLNEDRIYPVTLDPTIVKFQPKYALADTNIRSAFPKQTAPTETTLGVGLYKDTKQTNVIRSLLKFDVSAIPQGADVISADLNMWLASVSNATDIGVSLHAINTPWTEYSASWMYADAGKLWANQGGDYNSSQVATTIVGALTTLDVNYKWSLTPYMVEKWINNSDTNIGFLLKSTSETSNTYKKFISGDDTVNTKQTPLLSVTYTSASRLGVENYWSLDSRDVSDGTNQINLGTGNNFLSFNDFDLEGRGEIALEFDRNYNSKSIELTPFGYGWTYSGYESIIDAYKTGRVLYTEADGTSHFFQYDSSTKQYTSPPGKYLILKKKTDAIGATIGYVIIDKYGYETHYEVVSSDSEVSIHRARISYEQDLHGNKLTYKYDSDGKLINIIDPSGRTLILNYNNSGLVSSAMLDTQKINYHYDSSKHLIYVDKYKDNTEYSRTQFEYNNEGYLSSVIDPNGARTDFTYIDEYIVMVQEPSNSEEDESTARPGVSYSYLPNKKTVVTDPLGNETEYYFNNNYSTISIIDAEGNEIKKNYDENHNIILETNAKGKTYKRTFDSFGNMIDETDEENNVTKYTYNSQNLKQSETDAEGNKTVFEYSDKGSLLKEIDAKGQITSYTYDDYGNQKSVTTPDGRTETYQYDESGNNIKTIVDANNNVTSTITDKNGNEIKSIDAEGNITLYEYDKQNRLIKITDAKNNNTSFEYDDAGNLIKTIYADNQTRVKEYNGLGQVIKSIDSLGNTYYYKYDQNGNRIETISPNGTVYTHIFNNLNELVQTKVGNEVIYSYSYDENGNIKSVNNNEQIFEYTDNGSLKTETERGSVKTFDYYLNGELKSLSYIIGDSNTSIEYIRDEINQVTEIKQNGKVVIKFSYDAAGDLVSAVNANGTYSKSEYDKGKNQTKYGNYRSDGSIINEYNYTHNKNNMVESIISSEGIVNYEYDNLNQLVQESLIDGRVINYEYDSVGNRISKQVIDGVNISTEIKSTFNKANQLESVNGKLYKYDNNGNLINDSENLYSYDAFDRLIEIKNIETQEIVFEAKYDEDGKRIYKKTDSEVRNYYYDGDQVLYETDGSGKVIIEYIWNEDGTPISFLYNGETYFYHMNGHGDIINITDKDGSIVATYSYDAWGNILKKEGSLADINPYLYAGYRYDKEIGLYYLKARYYDPNNGVFITLDPDPGIQDEPLGQNGYNYGMNNPIEFVDHNGEHPVIVVIYVGYRVYKGVKTAKKVYKIAKYSKTAVKATRKTVKQKKTGRLGKQARLKELSKDPKVSSALRGELKRDINQIKRKKRKTIRVPKGYELAHRRGYEARKGFGYKYSDLQTIKNHRLQHKYDNYGKKR